MSIASLKGKLSPTQDNLDRLEDALTSDVLSMVRYLPPAIGTWPWLGAATDEWGKSLAHWLEFRGLRSDDLDRARIRFWPKLKDGKEPDAALRFWRTKKTRPKLGVLLEAKYHSPQHDIEGDGWEKHSQLGHYGLHALHWSWEERAMLGERPEHVVILYLTMHRSQPLTSLERARQEIASKLHAKEGEIGLFWQNWQAICRTAKETWEGVRHDVEDRPWLRLLLDTKLTLERRGLAAEPRLEELVSPPPSLPRLPYVDSSEEGSDPHASTPHGETKEE